MTYPPLSVQAARQWMPPAGEEWRGRLPEKLWQQALPAQNEVVLPVYPNREFPGGPSIPPVPPVYGGNTMKKEESASCSAGSDAGARALFFCVLFGGRSYSNHQNCRHPSGRQLSQLPLSQKLESHQGFLRFWGFGS